MLLKPDSARGSWERHLPILLVEVLHHSQAPCDVTLQVSGHSKAGVQVMEEKGPPGSLGANENVTSNSAAADHCCLPWKQGMSAMALPTHRGRQFFISMGDRPVPCGVFSCMPHLCPPTRCCYHLAVPTSQNAPSHCQMSLRDQHSSH